MSANKTENQRRNESGLEGISMGGDKSKLSLAPPKFDNVEDERLYKKQRLAASFRIFAKYGFDEGVAGHLTVRDPEHHDRFWVNPFGMYFGHIKQSDLVQVDHSGKVVGGSNRPINAAAFAIHSAIHKARPDANAACHSHSIAGRAFASLGRELDIINQDSCAFYKSHAVYKNFGGVVLADEEGQNIAKTLGEKNKAVILQNHGLLTVGQSIEEAVFWFVSMDKTCKAQLLADAACAGRGGKPIVIDDEDAAATFNVVGSSFAGYFSALPLYQMIHEETKGDYMN